MLARMLVVAAIVTGCSRPVAHTDRVPPPPPTPVLDASVAADPPTDAAEVARVDPTGFRELVLPRPRVLQPATPESARCVAVAREEAARVHERERAAAGVDRAIRQRGLTPLPDAQELYTPRAFTPGEVVRGPQGERLMLVATVDGCVPTAPIFAMNAAHEIIAIQPSFIARRSRTIKFCTNSCYGMCGIARQVSFGVEVPADAKLGQPLTLDVPLDVQVTFEAPHDRGCYLP